MGAVTRTPKVSPSPKRLKARQQQRARAVLREADLRDEAQQRARKHQPLTLTPEQKTNLPLLTRHLETHDGWPPNISRKPGARVKHLEALRAAYGQLVLLRISLPSLDEFSLHSRALADAAREAIDVILFSLVSNDAPCTVSIQRGAEGGTHAHLVIPWLCFLELYADLIWAAPHGPDGGCALPYTAAHGVVIRDTTEDRCKVASYTVRHPDGRFDTPGTPAYLAALEDELRRKVSKQRRVALGWTVNVRSLSR